MENNKIFSEIQCGFRKYRSTADHLIRMDTFIRKVLANAEVISIFFDMEKAYDKTWRYGIMRDLHEAGLGGKMPMFIVKILESRLFQVKLQQKYSTLRTQESGVPQGSTISVTLFAIKINSLSRVIPREIRGRVDDLSFFEYLSPLCFLSIEFHCTFSISY